ncbi:hypothetical protein BO70DRAFT_85214 [Aspergillus heteromorphus CBS 117.55]|uniref:Tim17-domain-containing protein n=1 Tax=Aspergillus heteromorphus CBS 117.55 TaxID=1448321 RepID=A0A317WYP3_9EURO|nr:uncharacterized protein BO70DRAFT_85214 [Aspergillus heteromorphus CBS 117.55]PWY91115.1 hypothetical protein BO70DRAFT_85214 [Aspergillus heteromorphus CBS 117.55]
MDSQQPPIDNQDLPAGPRKPQSLFKALNLDKLFESDAPPRLGINLEDRLSYTLTSAFCAGMVIGFSHGKKLAGYQFRAENAHRFPSSTQGWFQYHKTKNYVSLLGGMKEGARMGARLGIGATVFCLFEETVDYARHDRRDFLSTVTAGLSLSGLYSLMARHDVYTAARTAKLGLKASLVYGVLQDALELSKGNRPAYMEFFLGSRPSKPE